MTTTTTTRPLKSVWMVSLCRLEACSSTKRPVSNFSRRFLSQPLTAAPPTIRSASITTCVCVRACVRGDANALVRSERRLYLCIYSFLYIWHTYIYINIYIYICLNIYGKCLGAIRKEALSIYVYLSVSNRMDQEGDGRTFVRSRSRFGTSAAVVAVLCVSHRRR